MTHTAETDTPAWLSVPFIMGTHHLAFYSTDEDEYWVKIRCNYIPDSTKCGLQTENDDHDPDACAAHGEGEDGCGDHPGWSPATGCAVAEVASQHGLDASELFDDDVDLETLPRDEWFPVTVRWEGWDIEDNIPRLRPHNAVVLKSKMGSPIDRNVHGDSTAQP